ncbi:hypothetical protein E2P81_ATG09142 [Venturia nashicola]|nr:hypothetical protein E2P81_ATG09142 [Venturia nashicola]
MPQATELATLPLLPDVDIATPGSEGHSVISGMVGTLVNQKGYLGIHYGRQHENPDNLVLAIDWASIKSHKDFEQTEAYLPFVQKIGTIMSGPVHMQHVEFREPLATAAVAPIVEMLTLYFPDHVDRTNVETTLVDFLQTIVDNAKGFVGYTTGWVVEELEHEKIEGKARAYAVTIGWESLEAHMAYRDTHTFKEDIVKVRAIAKGLALLLEVATKPERLATRWHDGTDPCPNFTAFYTRAEIQRSWGFLFREGTRCAAYQALGAPSSVSISAVPKTRF